jgi:hypothetical protein
MPNIALNRFSSSLFAALLASANLATADAPANAWQLSLSGGAVKQFESSLDNGGDFSVEHLFVEVGAARNIGTRLNAGLNLGYSERQYHFSGDQGLAALRPWDNIREIELSLPLRYRGEGRWSYFGIPSLRYAGTPDAKLADSQQWGLLAGAAYQFSDSLSIGPGIGVFSEIESHTDVFPILLVHWQISETFKLETGSGVAASRGPGLALRWTPARDWRFSLAARYEKTRFRLDEHGGPIAAGVGEDKSFPIAISLSYRAGSQIELNAIGGADVGGNLRLEDADGNKLIGSDYDIAPFAGIFATARF